MGRKTIINANPMTLENIGKGDTLSRFDRELEKVLRNIKDEETGLGKREIHIKIIITPGPDRDEADFDVDVTSKILPKPKYSSSMVIGQGVDGSLEAHEAIPVVEEHAHNANDYSDDDEQLRLFPDRDRDTDADI